MQGLVLRTWDEISQCQIRDFRVGFLSGGSEDMLNTEPLRRQALKRHADWGNRVKTPLISTSKSIHEIAEWRAPHFQRRQKKKGIKENTKLTLINLNARLAAGNPAMWAKHELVYYNVKNKYGENVYSRDSFYSHEILLPFSVGPKEIVGIWAWHQIERWIKEHNSDLNGWYAQVGIPAFNEHERIRLGGQPKPKDNCKIGCDCCGQ